MQGCDLGFAQDTENVLSSDGVCEKQHISTVLGGNLFVTDVVSLCSVQSEETNCSFLPAPLQW